eukprot:GSMAST32.ASY1.ANO1.2644.1 assembled CDS
MADADDATSALIAQMLANDYQNQRSSYYEMPSSDEEDRKRKAKKRKRTKSKGSKSKVAKKSAAASVQSNENNGKNTANKSSTGQTVTKNGKVRKKPRRWTAEEEVLFLEALELHGREWHKCVEHMGHTRNKGSFTSHAQKHFIKLYLADKPLPAKVVESGEGYTLSGKPLDPNSAAARAYGVVSKYTLDEAKVAKLSGRQLNLGQKTNGIRDTRATSAFTAAAAAAAELKKQKKLEARQAAAEKKRKEVNDRRLAREKAKREKLLAKTMEADARNRDLYGRERSSQPFRILVAPSVVVMADLHAHFTHREVIGYLAGHWDAPRRTITISKVFPGRSISEMDPVTEVGLRSEVAAAGLKVVGWYHSHPTFEPIPSMVDVNNQASYQQLFSDPSTGASESPFVALIVSPYDVQMPTDASTAKWFHVRSPNTERVPMKLEVDVSAQYEVCDISSKSVIIVENETKCSNKEEETKDKPVSKSPWSDSDSLRFDIGVKIMKRLLPEACALATKLGRDPLEAASIVDWNRVFRVVGADEPRSNISKLMESLRLRLRKSFGPKENDDDPSIESTILPSKNSWSEVCAKFIAELKLHVMKVASRNTTAGKSENESDAANETVAI